MAELVLRLKRLGFHIVVYTGNTIEKLTAKDDLSITFTLSHIDMLIDGPYKSSLVAGTGSIEVLQISVYYSRNWLRQSILGLIPIHQRYLLDRTGQ